VPLCLSQDTDADALLDREPPDVADDDLAVAYARATYDEERWCEMAIVRKEHVIELWQPGEP